MADTQNILLAGVGGQGIILASDLLSGALVRAGFDVKKSEIHGMAQRGGSVSSHVRFGEKVYSPVIGEGEADILLAFERLEALRYLHFLKKSGQMLASNQMTPPVSIASRTEADGKDLMTACTEYGLQATVVPAVELAKRAGNIRAANVVLLGAFSGFIPVEEEDWLSILEEKLPPKLVEPNITAFRLGREFMHA